ncbi:MAG: CBS domain-containing protein [Acidimicrobiales bacterium]|nr:CBS domain-containing protein [Acidimicrobiales bacterium]
MSKDEKVSSVMQHTTVTIQPSTTLREVADILVREEIGCAVVEGTGKVAGVVSERDLVRAVADDVDLDAERASDYMAFDVVAVDPHDDIAETARAMLDGGIRHLPVVDEGKVVGIISIRDVLAHLMD